MKPFISILACFSVMAAVTLAGGAEAPVRDVASDGQDALQLLINALPQFVFLLVLLINWVSSLMDSDRNSVASLIATLTLVGITYWGNFYKPLIDFFAIQL